MISTAKLTYKPPALLDNLTIVSCIFFMKFNMLSRIIAPGTGTNKTAKPRKSHGHALMQWRFYSCDFFNLLFLLII